MLSKDARNLLRFAKKEDGQKAEYFKIKKEFSWDYDKIKSVVGQLVSAGLADEKFHSPRPGSKVFWGIVLTEEGRNSKKYFWAKIGGLLFKSIVVPIAVSFITAILTTIAIGRL